jgi:nucleotide-binding universal stress UspA family protein
MNRILVGYDFSRPSESALAMAVNLARAFGAKISLIHVVPVMTTAEVYGARTADLWPDMLKSSELALKEVATSVKDIAVDTLATVGSAPREIAERADELNADLVVVGSTGKGAMKRLLLGSVADGVAHLCSRPVLIVK